MGKKIGPLPLWAWILIAGGAIGLILYKRSSSSSSSTTAADQVDPNNPLGLTYAQESQDIAAGIDPNTGVTYASEEADGTPADTSGDTSGGVTDSTDPGQTLAGEVTDLESGLSAISALQQLFAPTPATATKKKQPKLTSKRAIRAPSGPHKPAAKKGYTIKGLGNGNWEYVPTHKSNGSGSAGHTSKTHGKQIRRTTTHKHTTPKPPAKHPPARRVVSGRK